jgi:hypothetical protein
MCVSVRSRIERWAYRNASMKVKRFLISSNV